MVDFLFLKQMSATAQKLRSYNVFYHKANGKCYNIPNELFADFINFVHTESLYKNKANKVIAQCYDISYMYINDYNKCLYASPDQVCNLVIPREIVEQNQSVLKQLRSGKSCIIAFKLVRHDCMRNYKHFSTIEFVDCRFTNPLWKGKTMKHILNIDKTPEIPDREGLVYKTQAPKAMPTAFEQVFWYSYLNFLDDPEIFDIAIVVGASFKQSAFKIVERWAKMLQVSKFIDLINDILCDASCKYDDVTFEELTAFESDLFATEDVCDILDGYTKFVELKYDDTKNIAKVVNETAARIIKRFRQHKK